MRAAHFLDLHAPGQADGAVRGEPREPGLDGPGRETPSESVAAWSGPPLSRMARIALRGVRFRCRAAAIAASVAVLRALCPSAREAILATKRLPALSTLPSLRTLTVKTPL